MKLVRTMYGDCSVMIDVAAAITTIGIFALGGDRRGGQRQRRQAEAGEHVDLVVDDQLLREARVVSGDAGVVLDDQLDLLAGDRRRRSAPCTA